MIFHPPNSSASLLFSIAGCMLGVANIGDMKLTKEITTIYLQFAYADADNWLSSSVTYAACITIRKENSEHIRYSLIYISDYEKLHKTYYFLFHWISPDTREIYYRLFSPK